MKLKDFFINIKAKTDFKGAENKVKGLNSNIGGLTKGISGGVKMFAAFAAAVVAVGVAIWAMAKQAIGVADAIYDMQASTGLAATQVARFNRELTLLKMPLRDAAQLRRDFAETNILSGKDVANLRLLGRAAEFTKKNFQNLGNIFSAVLAPALSRTLREINKLTRSGGTLSKVIKVLAKVLATIIDIITRVVSSYYRLLYSVITSIMRVIKDFIDKTIGLSNALKILGLVLLGLAAYFFPVQTVIVGLLLVLEDIIAFTEGKKSVFGLLVDFFKDLGKSISGSFSNIANLVANFKPLKEMIENLKQGWKDFINSIKSGDILGAFKSIGNMIKDFFVGAFKIVLSIIDSIKQKFDVTGFFKGIGDWFRGLTGQDAALSSAQAGAASAVNTVDNSASSVINQNNYIDGGNPDAVTRAIEQGNKNSLGQARFQQRLRPR